MAAGDTAIGTGATMTFATSAGMDSWELLSVEYSGVSRPSIRGDYMGIAAAKKYPGDIIDWGQLRLSFNLTGNERPPIADAVQLLTITLPAADVWTMNGFMTDFEFSVPMEDVMTCECTFEIDGTLTAPV